MPLCSLSLSLLQALRALTGGLLQRLVGLLGHGTGLGVRDLLRGALHQRLQPWHQRQHLGGVLHQLAHVVHDLAL